jgi:LSD1 subclass zinc finger protein
MLAEALACLSESGVKAPVYVAHGKVWSLGADGTLSAKEDKVAAPVSWALGHDVRPARMARGAKPVKCADCHTVDSKFFFGDVVSTGPLMTAQKQVKAQAEYMGVSGSYNRLFGVTFLMRPMFKNFLWVVFAFVALVAIAFAAAAIPSMLMCGDACDPYGKRNAKLMEQLDKFAALGMVVSTFYLALSGIAGWFFHLMTGYILVFHMVAGGLFATCLLALIWLRGGKRIRTKRNVLWMVMLVLGVCVLFTAVAPMMTWLGEEWQRVLLQGHRCSTMCFILVSVWMCICGGRKE